MPLVLRPSPALVMSRVIAWRARCASATASVRWFSRARTFIDVAIIRPAATMMTIVTPSATISSMSEKPAAPFATSLCFCIVITPAPRARAASVVSHDVLGAVAAQHHAAARPAPRVRRRHGHGDHLLAGVRDVGVVGDRGRDVEGALVVVGRVGAADVLRGGHGGGPPGGG